jgi:hypothetical protein
MINWSVGEVMRGDVVRRGKPGSPFDALTLAHGRPRLRRSFALPAPGIFFAGRLTIGDRSLLVNRVKPREKQIFSA